MLLFLPIMLCYSALNLIHYVQYYAQEQELWSEYYAIYIKVCMNNSSHVADDFYKHCFIRVHY